MKTIDYLESMELINEVLKINPLDEKSNYRKCLIYYEKDLLYEC